MAFTCIELETRRRQLGLSQTDLGVCIGLLSPKDPAIRGRWASIRSPVGRKA